MLFTLPVSACQDMEHGLLTAVAEETHGAVTLTRGLPTVPDLVVAQGLEVEGQAELESWWESWSLGALEGAKAREGVYSSVSAKVYPYLNIRGVTELLTQNEASLRTARRLGGILATREIEAALENALRYHDEAWTALQDGDGEEAIRLALRCADAIRAVSPEQVATGLLKKAQEALGRNEASGSYSVEELTRIRRLATGAKEALEGGDYPRAIRRAYYACQLLGVDPG